MDVETASSALLKFVEDFYKPEAMRSENGGNVSYDDLLIYLMELECTEENDHLTLMPRFFSLTILAQLRCLFKVQQHCSQISVSPLDKFICMLEAHSHSNSWIKHGIQQLKRERNKTRPFKHDETAEDSFIENYVFTRESESLKNELIRKLKTTDKGKETHPIDKRDPQSSMKEIGEEKVDLVNLGTNVDFTRRPSLESDLWDRKDIVIEVDSDIDGITDKFGVKTDEWKIFENQKALISGDKSKEENCIIITSESGDSSPEGNKDKSRPSRALKKRRKHRSCSRDNSNKETAYGDVSDVVEHKHKKQNMDINTAVLDMNDSNNSVQVKIGDVAEIGNQEGNLHEIGKMSELQFQLSSLKEKISSDSRSEIFAIEFWEIFMNLNHAQLSEACEFLMLSSLSDDTLLILCDCLSSLNLSHQVEIAFLNSTLSHKLSSLTDRPSQTLLNILYSVIEQKPRTTIEIMCDCIEKAKSGEPQCQVLLSLSKRNLPTDCIPFFIRQLSSKDIQMNSHLTSALQELLNKAADLDHDSLKLLLISLSRNSQGLHTSVQFGKLILTIITRFKRKITNELRNLMTEMVNGHKSSLKKSLLKKLDAE